MPPPATLIPACHGAHTPLPRLFAHAHNAAAFSRFLFLAAFCHAYCRSSATFAGWLYSCFAVQCGSGVERAILMPRAFCGGSATLRYGYLPHRTRFLHLRTFSRCLPSPAGYPMPPQRYRAYRPRRGRLPDGRSTCRSVDGLAGRTAALPDAFLRG